MNIIIVALNMNNPTEFILSLLQLIRELGNINVKKKEPPFCYPYSLKARVLVLSHLARMEVSEELEEGGHVVTPSLRSQMYWH